jgi:archaeosine synthase beta-subunit
VSLVPAREEQPRGSGRLAPADRRIRAARPPKEAVDPRRPLGVLWEEERTPDRGVVPALTVFLAGAECPFTCVFCDLWRRTLDGPTPPGSLPAQLERALAEAGEAGPARLSGALVKLYNAGNFFDPRAVPAADEGALAALVASFFRVVVESHPRLVGERALRFAAALGGRLEVAMGLETVHPRALPRLNKRMTVADFDRAAERLAAGGVGLRAFVLVGAPFVPPAEAVEWAVRSAAHAFARGAGTVALIPVRGGNGALEELAARGEWEPPTLALLEEALDRCVALGGGVAVADLWDLPRLARCPACAEPRRRRLARINLSGRTEPRIACGECGGG